MMAFDQHKEWLLASMPIVGAFIIVRGTGLGAFADTVVTICALVALLSFAHIIDLSSLIGG